MPVDRYTKAVLTVTALALSAIAVQNATRPATAQHQIMRVILCDADDQRRCASLVDVGPTSSPAFGLLTRDVPRR